MSWKLFKFYFQLKNHKLFFYSKPSKIIVPVNSGAVNRFPNWSGRSVGPLLHDWISLACADILLWPLGTWINFQETSTEFIREYIIVNDGSTVESYQSLQRLAKENEIQSQIQIKNLGKRTGLIQARNLGAKFASGRVFGSWLHLDGLN